MRVNSLFITATDTGVGKSVIAGALAAYMRAGGINVGVMKPAETGCVLRKGVLQPSDAAFLKRVSGSKDPLELICPCRFSEPLAPAIAAERAGEAVDVGRIVSAYHEIVSRHEAVIVEGAGGLMVPIFELYTFLTLARELRLPVIIVGRAGLGTINHTLLTLNAARETGLDVRGIILNQGRRESGAAVETNPDAIRRFAGGVPVIPVGYHPGIKRDPGQLVKLGELIMAGLL